MMGWYVYVLLPYAPVPIVRYELNCCMCSICIWEHAREIPSAGWPLADHRTAVCSVELREREWEKLDAIGELACSYIYLVCLNLFLHVSRLCAAGGQTGQWKFYRMWGISSCVLSSSADLIHLNCCMSCYNADKENSWLCWENGKKPTTIYPARKGAKFPKLPTVPHCPALNALQLKCLSLIRYPQAITKPLSGETLSIRVLRIYLRFKFTKKGLIFTCKI